MKWLQKRMAEGRLEKALVALMQAAGEDPLLHQRLEKILSLPAFHRQSLLNTWIAELRLQNAPHLLIDAMTGLLDDEAAKHALRLLQEGEAPKGDASPPGGPAGASANTSAE